MRPPVVQIQPEPVARLHNVALKGIVESKCEQASKRHENGGILVTKEFAVKEGTIERMEYRRADGRLVRITAIVYPDETLYIKEGRGTSEECIQL